MRDRLLEIISEIIKIDVDALKKLQDDESVWDSLLKVEVIFEIEDEFDIMFSAEELAELKTPQQFIEAVICKENNK